MALPLPGNHSSSFIARADGVRAAAYSGYSHYYEHGYIHGQNGQDLARSGPAAHRYGNNYPDPYLPHAAKFFPATHHAYGHTHPSVLNTYQANYGTQLLPQGHHLHASLHGDFAPSPTMIINNGSGNNEMKGAMNLALIGLLGGVGLMAAGAIGNFSKGASGNASACSDGGCDENDWFGPQAKNHLDIMSENITEENAEEYTSRANSRIDKLIERAGDDADTVAKLESIKTRTSEIINKIAKGEIEDSEVEKLIAELNKDIARVVNSDYDGSTFDASLLAFLSEEDSKFYLDDNGIGDGDHEPWSLLEIT